MLTNIYNFLAEIPWYIPAVLLLAGAVLLYTGSSRLDRKMTRAGLSAVLLGLLAMGVSWLLVSDRERVMGLTRQLVKAVEARDWAKMESLMHPNAMAFTVFKGRDVVVNATRLGVERIELKSVTVTSMSTRPDGDELTALLGVYSTAKSEANVLTNWELDWAKRDGRWQLIEIRGIDGPWVRASDLAAWIERGK